MGTVRTDLSSELRALRERHGWTQGIAAAFLGVDRTQVSRWEGGQRCGVPFVAQLVALGLRLSADTANASLDKPGKPADRLAVVSELEPAPVSVPAPPWMAAPVSVPTEPRTWPTTWTSEDGITVAIPEHIQGPNDALWMPYVTGKADYMRSIGVKDEEDIPQG